MAQWYIRRIDHDRGCVTFEVYSAADGELIASEIVNRNIADLVAASPDLVTVLRAAQRFLKANRRGVGVKQLLQDIDDAIKRAS